MTSLTVDLGGTIEVKGAGSNYQVTTGSDFHGGPTIISVYSEKREETKTFKRVSEAMQYFKSVGVKSQDLKKLHRLLSTSFKDWESKKRDYRAGPLGYGQETKI